MLIHACIMWPGKVQGVVQNNVTEYLNAKSQVRALWSREGSEIQRGQPGGPEGSGPQDHV